MISQNINIIRENLGRICSLSGRSTDNLRLIAVSKNTGIEAICQAFDAGISDFGESKAQELTEKARLIEKDIRWHFIGHLQKNKAKYVVPVCCLIHSVDSFELASEINKQAQKSDKVQDILLEVKTSDEEGKFGIETYDELLEIAQNISSLSNVRLKGLMTMAPFVEDDETIRKSFSMLRGYLEGLNEKGFALTELSMGMTGDYPIAIEEGATLIRIGTAIFGPRDYSKSWKEQ